MDSMADNITPTADQPPSGEAGHSDIRSDIEQGPLQALVGYNLRRANTLALRILQDFVPELDVTAWQFGTLSLIADNPGLIQAELGKAQGIDKSTVAPAIDRLEQRGLVARRPSPRDRRSKALHLTPAGEKLYHAARARVAEADARLTACLSADEIVQLNSLLLRLYADD